MKPRRKHPGLQIIEVSLQGLHMMTLITDRIGPFNYVPLDAQRGGGTTFLLIGDEGVGFLVEGKEQADGEHWLHRWQFFHRPVEELAFEVSLTARRWDPWLAAARTGDRTALDLSPARRRDETQQRSIVAGTRGDVVSCAWYGRDAEPTEILGFAVSRLEELAVHHLVGGKAARLSVP